MNAKHNQGEDPAAKRLAFNQAFEMLGAEFETFFNKRVFDKTEAEDVCQAFWAQVYKQFTAKQFFQVKLLQNKANQVLANYCRYAGVRKIVDYTNTFPEVTAPSHRIECTPQEEADAKERVWEMFPNHNLSEADKELVWLRGRYDLSYPEISKRLAIPESTLQDRFERLCVILAASYNRE